MRREPQMLDKVFDLLTRGFAKGFGTAEIDGVGFYQVGIDIMLPYQLAEAVANFGPAIIAVSPLAGWGESFFGSPERGARSANEPISSTEQMPMP